MKKPIMLVPRNAAREMLPGPDLDRLLASGSWVVVHQPKSRNLDTVRATESKRRLREMGFRLVNAYLPPDVFAELHRQQLAGETLAETIERLLGYGRTKVKKDELF